MTLFLLALVMASCIGTRRTHKNVNSTTTTEDSQAVTEIVHDERSDDSILIDKRLSESILKSKSQQLLSVVWDSLIVQYAHGDRLALYNMSVSSSFSDEQHLDSEIHNQQLQLREVASKSMTAEYTQHEQNSSRVESTHVSSTVKRRNHLIGVVLYLIGIGILIIILQYVLRRFKSRFIRFYE